METTIVKARRLLKKALEEDAELYHVYEANIACLVRDNLPLPAQDWDRYGEIAKRLLYTIFDVERPDA